jgi:hypothetical protein
MFHRGRIVFDVSGDERRGITVADLIALFKRDRGKNYRTTRYFSPDYLPTSGNMIKTITKQTPLPRIIEPPWHAALYQTLRMGPRTVPDAARLSVR